MSELLTKFHSIRLTIKSALVGLSKYIVIFCGKVRSSSKKLLNGVFRFVKFIFTRFKILFYLVFGFVLIFGYEYYFTGDVRYYIHDNVTNSDKAIEIGQNAIAKTEEKHSTEVYFTELLTNETNPFKSFIGGLEGKSIRDYIDGSLALQSEPESFIQANITLNIVAIYDSIISTILTNREVRKAIVIRAFSVSDNQEVRLNVLLYPDSGALIPSTDYADVEYVEDQLSHRLLEYLYEHTSDCSGRVCSSDLPIDQRSLESMIVGFDITQKKNGSSYCVSLDQVQCMDVAVSKFRESISMDSIQSLSYFGLFLANIIKASELVKSENVRETAETIAEASENYNKSIANSEVLKEILTNKENLEQLFADDDFQSLDLNVEYLINMEAYPIGRDLYQRGKYTEAIEEFKRISEVSPNWFRGIVRLQILNSEWYIADRKTGDDMIIRLEELEEYLNPSVYLASLARFQAFSESNTVENLKKARATYDTVLDSMGPGVHRDAVLLQRTRVDYKIGNKRRAEKQVNDIEKIYTNVKSCDIKYASLYYGMADYYDASNSIEQTMLNLRRAILCNPNFYQGEVYQSVLRNSNDYQTWKSKLGNDLRKLESGEVTCEEIW